MKPFDLQKALAGEPVVTRDGKPVTQITKFDANERRYCVAAVIDCEIETFSIDGKFRIEDISQYDLFMATKTVKKEGWVNLYKGFDGKYPVTGSTIFDTKDDAINQRSASFITTVKIEWEEEI